MRRGLIWSLVGIIAVAVAALGATIATSTHILLGLDLRGGVSVVLQPQGTVDNATLQQAVSIIENRVNGLGVADSSIQRQGRDVVINLPGIKDSQAALRTLGTTAELHFRPVLCEVAPYAPTKSSPSTTTPGASTPTTGPAKQGAGLPAASAAHLTASFTPLAAGTAVTTPAVPATPATPPATPTTSGSTLVQAACSSTVGSSIPSTTPAGNVSTASVILPASTSSGYGNIRFALGPADLTGRGVKTAFVSVTQTGSYAVNVNFTGSGSNTFDQIAAARNKYFNKAATSPDPRSLEAIELDGQVESAPTIEQSSFNGQVQITGNFSSSQANSLALELKYGSLPVRFTPQSVQTVSATIGKDSLRAGLLAGLGGIVVVLLYMILYYRALGLVVMLGLLVGGALLYAILALLSQTSSLALTLSGVTGIIVSVGITVDSYVVYFERLKDEVRAGRTIRQSVERSFARAFRTVLTADFVSFLAAFILYILTVGDVRGFAFTLGLSTLLDVFTAYFFIRPMVILVGRRRTFTEARILGVARGLGASAGGAV